MGNPTATNQQGAVTPSNPVFPVRTVGGRTGVFVGDVAWVDVAPANGEQHPDATVYADGCKIALAEDADWASPAVTSEAAPFGLGLWQGTVRLFLKAAQAMTAPKLYLPSSGYVALETNLAVGGGGSESGGGGTVTEAEQASGGGGSESGGGGNPPVQGSSEAATGGGGSESGGGGSVTEIEQVSGGGGSESGGGGAPLAQNPSVPLFGLLYTHMNGVLDNTPGGEDYRYWTGNNDNVYYRLVAPGAVWALMGDFSGYNGGVRGDTAVVTVPANCTGVEFRRGTTGQVLTFNPPNGGLVKAGAGATLTIVAGSWIDYDENENPSDSGFSFVAGETNLDVP